MPALLAIALIPGACGRSAASTETPSNTSQSHGTSRVGSAFFMSMPAQERTNLRDVMSEGLPVFRRTDDRLELLDGCRYPGTLEFHAHEKKELTFSGGTESELHRNTLDGLAAPGLTRGEPFVTHVVMVGEKDSTIEHPDVAHLVGPNCRGATHVASNVAIGACLSMRSSTAQGRDLYEVIDSCGVLSNCDLAYDAAPPNMCDQPVGGKIAPLEFGRKTLGVYFDARTVQGAR